MKKRNVFTARYSVFAGEAAAFVVDDQEHDRDPVVSRFPYLDNGGQGNAIRIAAIHAARLNREYNERKAEQ